jgi:hypothetical protein
LKYSLRENVNAKNQEPRANHASSRRESPASLRKAKPKECYRDRRMNASGGGGAWRQAMTGWRIPVMIRSRNDILDKD